MNTITVHKKYLLFRCVERGYSIEEVMPCVIAQDGDNWTVDTSHASYPISPKSQKIEISGGVGTELKKLLKLIGITASPTCSCNARAKTMDENGTQWCEDNKDTIVGWLEEEANKRNLPFSSYLATTLINFAIKKAKKAQTQQNS
jgi:hypothetical protein